MNTVQLNHRVLHMKTMQPILSAHLMKTVLGMKTGQHIKNVQHKKLHYMITVLYMFNVDQTNESSRALKSCKAHENCIVNHLVWLLCRTTLLLLGPGTRVTCKVHGVIL